MGVGEGIACIMVMMKCFSSVIMVIVPRVSRTLVSEEITGYAVSIFRLLQKSITARHLGLLGAISLIETPYSVG